MSHRLKATKKRVVLLGGLLLLALLQSLNFTGFCYSEMRYLSDLELTYAGITFPSDPSGMVLSKEEQEKWIKEPGKDYPFCCRVNGKPSWISPELMFAEKILGHYLYEVVSYVPNPNIDAGDYQRYPYYVTESSVNACGKHKNYETGISIGKKLYDANIQQIKKFWEGKLQ